MAEQIPVGESIDLKEPANYVQLPDGTVVTARRHYTVQHEGEHVAGSTKFYGVPAKQKAEPEPEPSKPSTSKPTSKK